MSTEGAVSPSTPSGDSASTFQHHLGRRRTPYAILAAIQVFAALCCAMFAVPGFNRTGDPVIYARIALALLVIAAITWWLLPMVPDGFGLDVGLGSIYLLAVVVTVQTPTDEGQVLIGLGLTAFAVFAAYFLPRRRLQVSLALMLTLYGVGERANEQMSSPAVYWMIVAVIVGLTILVSRLVEKLRALALHDELTTLLNRRGLDLLAPPLLAACVRSGIPVTVGLVDLDQFKAYNDTHGHLAGDRLLKNVALAWNGAMRESDLACRFGGDEFAVVLVDTSLDAARSLERRVREEGPETRGAASAAWSAGWAHVEPGESLYGALERADVALFAAKKEHGARRL